MLRLPAVCILSLSLAVPALADLKIQSVKATYGSYGPVRSDLQKPLKVYPGDEVALTCVVTGVTTDKDGSVSSHLTAKLLSPDGKALLDTEVPAKGLLPLGGAQVAGSTNITFAQDYPPGQYTYSLTFVDELANTKATFECKIELLAPAFCIAGLHFFLDADGKMPASGTFTIGQKMYFRFVAMGFDRSLKKIKLAMLVQTLEENGKELMPKPLRVEVGSEDPDQVAGANSVTFNANLALNRPGAYRVRIILKDEVNNKELKVEVPIKVVD
jgi:hypothetical protein